METISIRDLRGSSLRESARRGEPLMIANHRVLVGVFVPVTPAWVEQLIDYNWPRVRQSITEGESAMTAGTPLVTLDGVLTGDGNAAGHGDGDGQSPDAPEAASAKLATPLSAAAVGGAVVQTPESKEAIERLRAALSPPRSSGGHENGADEPSAHTVRIGDLSAGLIEKAGAAGQTLAITHDRELIGIVIPITPGLVQFLIEQNVSRVLLGVGVGEGQLSLGERLATLSEVLGEPAPTGATR